MCHSCHSAQVWIVLSHCLFLPNCIRALYDAMRAKRAAAGATLAGP
jgi:hypothetical protein